MTNTFNTSTIRRTRLVGIALSFFLMLSPELVSAQVIRLQKQITSDSKQNIRLGDLATVSGTDAKTAEGLMNLIILPELTDTRTIRAEAVLMAIIAQVGPGSLADHLQVAGAATCQVQIAGKTPVAAKGASAIPLTAAAETHAPTLAAAATPASTQPAVGAAADPKQVPQPRGPKLSQLLITKIQEDLATGPENVRVSFDTMSPLLEQPAPAGRQWVLRSLARTLLGTVQFEAQLVDGPRVVQKLNIQMQVLKREPVLLASNPIARGDVITKSHFKVDETWMDRKMPTLLTYEKDVLGLEALRDLPAGSMLDQRDFRPVTMAAARDVVSVIFLHGNLKVQMKARAMDNGKLHDTIQVKNETTNELYDAVLIGKRLAVVGGTLNEAQEKLLREAK